MVCGRVESGGQCSGCGRVVAAVCVQLLCGVSDEEFAATTATIDGEASGGIIGGVEQGCSRDFELGPHL